MIRKYKLIVYLDFTKTNFIKNFLVDDKSDLKIRLILLRNI